MTALLIKESVNQTVDAMGFATALDAASRIHQLNHAHWGEVDRRTRWPRDRRVRTRRLAGRARDPARGQRPALSEARPVDIELPARGGGVPRPDPLVPRRAPARGLVRARGAASGRAGKFARRWRTILAAAAWSRCPGRRSTAAPGCPLIEQLVLAEEFARAGAPERDENDLLGIDLLGNTLIALGHREQKRHFLPRILNGEDRWCQGFSEPDAGSDLAAVRTRAVLDGDEWVINGQKTWTSAGADRQLDLPAGTYRRRAPPNTRACRCCWCRWTSPAWSCAPSSMRPDTRRSARSSSPMPAPARANVVGGLGDGWPTAMTLLGFERGSQVITAAIEFGRDLERLCALAARPRVHTEPRIRDELAWCYSRVQIMRYRGYRGLTLVAERRTARRRGGDQQGDLERVLPPLHRTCRRDPRTRRTRARRARATAAHCCPEAGTPNTASCWMDELLYARAATIYAGSSQIQRNVIGEQLLVSRENHAGTRPTRRTDMDFRYSTEQNDFRSIVAQFSEETTRHWRGCGRWHATAATTTGCGSGYARSSNCPRCTPRPNTAGPGATLVETAIAFDELGRALTPVPFAATMFAIEAVLRMGDEDQRKTSASRPAQRRTGRNFRGQRARLPPTRPGNRACRTWRRRDRADGRVQPRAARPRRRPVRRSGAGRRPGWAARRHCRHARGHGRTRLPSFDITRPVARLN